VPYTLEETTGTVMSWETANRTLILFPRQVLTIEGEERVCGGADLRSPFYGPMPHGGAYADIKPLPQHGFVRDGNRHSEVHRRAVSGGVEFVYRFNDLELSGFPWEHEVSVRTTEEMAVGEYKFMHAVSVRRGWDSNPRDMPFSCGLHPYFSTYGEQFSIYDERGVEIFNRATFVPGTSYFRTLGESKAYSGRTALGVVTVRIRAGYKGFCIWTDCSQHYVCLGPILWKEGNPELLRPGDSRDCLCEFIFRPGKANTLPVM